MAAAFYTISNYKRQFALIAVRFLFPGNDAVEDIVRDSILTINRNHLDGVIRVDAEEMLRHILQVDISGRVDIQQETRSFWFGRYEWWVQLELMDVFHR